MDVSCKEIRDNISCRAFNGILGECADLLEERMPFFNVWKTAWNFLTCHVVIEEGQVRYYGEYVTFRDIVGCSDDEPLVVKHWESVYATTDPASAVIVEMFNKRILKVVIKERGCYNHATKEWGGK